MMDLGTVLEHQRREIESRGRLCFVILLATFALSAFCFGVVLSSVLPGSDGPGVWARIVERTSDLALELSTLFLSFAAGSGFWLWRLHHQKMKLLIAQAFMYEGDKDSAVRLLLGAEPGQMGRLGEALDLG